MLQESNCDDYINVRISLKCCCYAVVCSWKDNKLIGDRAVDNVDTSEKCRLACIFIGLCEPISKENQCVLQIKTWTGAADISSSACPPPIGTDVGLTM